MKKVISIQNWGKSKGGQVTQGKLTPEKRVEKARKAVACREAKRKERQQQASHLGAAFHKSNPRSLLQPRKTDSIDHAIEKYLKFRAQETFLEPKTSLPATHSDSEWVLSGTQAPLSLTSPTEEHPSSDVVLLAFMAEVQCPEPEDVTPRPARPTLNGNYPQGFSNASSRTATGPLRIDVPTTFSSTT